MSKIRNIIIEKGVDESKLSIRHQLPPNLKYVLTLVVGIVILFLAGTVFGDKTGEPRQPVEWDEAQVFPVEAYAVQPETVEEYIEPAAPLEIGDVSPVNGLVRPELSPIFTPNVLRWRDQIVDAAWTFGFDPNLLAIVVTAESCGSPNAVSSAGARGLAQVMPFHFAAGEDPFDPETNLYRGAAYFAAGLATSQSDLGLTFAGYNGGHGRIQKGYNYWPAETIRYHQITTAIYADLLSGAQASEAVNTRCPQ